MELRIPISSDNNTSSDLIDLKNVIAVPQTQASFCPGSSRHLVPMPKAPEDMTLEDYNLVCDGMTCRSLASPFTCQAPQGLFHHLNFPMVPVETTDCNPSVHYLDVVKNYRLDISLADLERKYKDAIINKDLQLLPEPLQQSLE